MFIQLDVCFEFQNRVEFRHHYSREAAFSRVGHWVRTKPTPRNSEMRPPWWEQLFTPDLSSHYCSCPFHLHEENLGSRSSKSCCKILWNPVFNFCPVLTSGFIPTLWKWIHVSPFNILKAVLSSNPKPKFFLFFLTSLLFCVIRNN